MKINEIQRLAKKLARLTGETMIEAVGWAIPERLERLRRQRDHEGLAARILEIGNACAALPVLDRRTANEMLYDEHGAPK